MFRVISAGRLFSCREGVQISGVQTCLLAEVVNHSQRSYDPVEGPVYTLRVSADSTPKVSLCWRGPEGTCAPDQARFSASLINVVSGPVRLNWSSSCVPLTRGFKIPWRVLWVAWGCQLTPRPCYPGAGGTRRALFNIFIMNSFVMSSQTILNEKLEIISILLVFLTTKIHLKNDLFIG